MTREESKSLVDKIQVYRQSFLITKIVYEEWFRVLEPYDYEDVNNKLDDYFRDSDNFGRYPDVYYLTRFLKTIEEKKILSIPHALCQICGKSVEYEKYNKHYERCSSIDYIVEMSKRYLGKELKKSELFELNDFKFDELYYKICYAVYNKMPDGFPKHILENVLLTHEGKEPNYDVDKVLEASKVYDRVS